MQVLALQGDTVDDLCYRHLGTSAVLEAVLELNPGISALGAILPMGTPVTLPDTVPATTTATNVINLWD